MTARKFNQRRHQMSKEISPDKVIMAYTASREEISKIKKEMEAKITEIEKFQTKREEWLQNYLDKNHLKNVATTFGTAYPALKESVTVADWDRVVEEVIVEPVYEAFRTLKEGPATNEQVKELIRSALKMNFLNRAVNKTAVLEEMGDLEDTEEGKRRKEAPMAGVSYSAQRCVQIRKS
jgi:hypothetical protein